ncbi:hypothetical protein F7725_006253 [Dissostichus mawsoni]|uniref:Uncharacterized protein n=1 Tax=Dissostichus mawsoni TaxID=36200 RepID=A0A7J5YXP3_DISMA|nr:hypothetical protein F7725_006253 [Dissostichus mawsoni]
MMFSSYSQAFHKEGQELTLGTTSVHSILSLSLIININLFHVARPLEAWSTVCFGFVCVLGLYVFWVCMCFGFVCVLGLYVFWGLYVF